MAGFNLGSFAGGFADAFSRAQNSKVQQTLLDKELKAKTKLYELQLKKEQMGLDSAQASQDALSQVGERMAGRAPLSAAPGTFVEDPRGPASLPELLADPEGTMLMLRAGMLNPADILKQGSEPDSVRLLRALQSDPALAEIDMRRKAAGASTTSINMDAQGLSKPPTGFFRPDPSKPGLQIEPGGQVEIDTKAKKRDLDNALNLYQTAKEGLISGLSSTTTGPLIGNMPAITSGQQIAKGSVAAMAPIMKQLFRAAGEGVFTDKDQELLISMIPTRETNPKARESMLQNIDAIIMAKLGLGKPQNGGNEIDFSELPD